jgi:hypothetical protein
MVIVVRMTALAVPLLLVAGVACGHQADHSIAAYCGQVQSNLVPLNAPAISTAADIDTTLAMYHAIGDLAPAAVAPEWQTMIASLETVSTLVPGDPDQVAAVNEAALSSQSAATRIQQYTKQQCNLDIGTPPPPTNPVTATTVAPPATT